MAKFVVKKTSTGFKFDLKAGNGQVIASSQVYAEKKACLNGVDSVKKNAPVANHEDLSVEPVQSATNPKFELYKDNAGEYRFRLKARNGEIIASSEGYTAKSNCLNGIESVRKNAAEASIEEEV